MSCNIHSGIITRILWITKWKLRIVATKRPEQTATFTNLASFGEVGYFHEKSLFATHIGYRGQCCTSQYFLALGVMPYTWVMTQLWWAYITYYIFNKFKVFAVFNSNNLIAFFVYIVFQVLPTEWACQVSSAFRRGILVSSAWYIVILTLERFTVVYYPF